MTRFKELKRIENAIKSGNMEDLLWSEDYCQWRVNSAFDFHPKKIAKGARSDWQKRLGKVQEAIQLVSRTQGNASQNLYEKVRTFDSKSKEKYVHVDDAKNFIDICEKENIGILGFDGLYCEEGSVMPDLDLIADYSELKRSSPDFVYESCLAARSVIQGFPKKLNLYIDFVIGDTEDS